MKKKQQAEQIAENPTLLSFRAKRGISLFPGSKHREIPRFARNDKIIFFPQAEARATNANLLRIFLHRRRTSFPALAIERTCKNGAHLDSIPVPCILAGSHCGLLGNTFP